MSVPDIDRRGLLHAQMMETYRVNMDDLGWAEFCTLWESLEDVADTVQWGKALLCAAVDARYGEEAIKSFASELGIGESTAYRYRRTFYAFPRVEDRYADLAFGHHALAATTNDPHYWMEKASLHEMSTYALEKDIRKTQQQTKAALVEAAKKAIESGGEEQIEEIVLPPNHQVPLAAARPASYPVEEERATIEELESTCAQFVYELIEAGFLVGDISRAFRAVIMALEGKA